MDKTELIGQVETISLPSLDLHDIDARIDTGAKTSAIWAVSVKVVDNKLRVVFFNHKKTKTETIFDAFTTVTVYSSNGVGEKRFKIKMPLIIAGRTIKASFTLSDRSRQTYPVLIGRNVLKSKFIVDVAKPVKES